MSQSLVQAHFIAEGERQLTEAGRPFLRNAAVFFDPRLWPKEPNRHIFSIAS